MLSPAADRGLIPGPSINIEETQPAMTDILSMPDLDRRPKPPDTASTTTGHGHDGRDDHGFSFAQLIVSMIISGILLTAVGFTVFGFINQARDTVLASNIRTAAEAVQNVIALNPEVNDTAHAASGQADQRLVSALTNNAPFTWRVAASANTSAFPGDEGWRLTDETSPDIIHIQLIQRDEITASRILTAAVGAAATGGQPRGGPPPIGVTADAAPSVRWLVSDNDAIRIQTRNDDGSWACALIVMRPDWEDGRTDTTPSAATIAEVESRLRGIWYDAGAHIEEEGLHNCSPTNVTPVTPATGTANADAGDTVDRHDVLPASSQQWVIGDRTLERSVPDFE